MDKMILYLKNKKLQAAVAGLFAVFGIYFAFCLSTAALSRGRAVFMLLHLIAVLLSGGAYLLFCRLSAEWESVRGQMTVINGVFLVCSVLFLTANLVNGSADGASTAWDVDASAGVNTTWNADGAVMGKAGASAGEFAVYQWLSQFLCAAIPAAGAAFLYGGQNRKTARENIEDCRGRDDVKAEESCAAGSGKMNDGERENKRRTRLRGRIVSRLPLFLLCLITMVLVYDPAMRQFKWDGGLYYLAARSASVYSVSSTALYGHISQTVGVAIRFLTTLMGNDLASGMMLGNALILFASICAFYGILKALLPERREMVYVTAAAVYAWSPFALGMVNYYSLDFYCMCLFVIVAYYTLKRQWVLQALTGLFFCFTKEPAIVIYGMLCIGIVAADLWKGGRGKFSDKIKRMFCTPQYYAMAAAAVLWAATIMMLGAWSGGNGGFSVSGAYILEKCKVLYILNFNWLCTAFILAGGMILILSKKITADKVRMLLPLLTAQAGFTLFSALFQTVNHARYADSSPVCLYLLCCYVLAELAELFFSPGKRFMPAPAAEKSGESGSVPAPAAAEMEGNRRASAQGGRTLSVVYAALAGILLISCYRTIDPVSMAVFRTVDIGTETMITTGTPAPGDSMIYNKQALWFEEALSDALSDVEFGEETVLFATNAGNVYHLEGFAAAETLAAGEYRLFQEYWNRDLGCREPVFSKSSIPFQAAAAADMEALKRLMREHPAGKYVYLYSECTGTGMAGEIGRAFHVTDLEIYESGGWRVYKMIFEE